MLTPRGQMPFQITEQLRDDFQQQGCVIFRELLPPSLIRDLRRATDKARDIARAKKGAQALSLKPVLQFDVDPRPFHDYAELPEYREAITRVLSPRHQPTNFEVLSVLFEPAEMPYCIPWHRDWRDNTPGFPSAEWEAVYRDLNLNNQINCALYEDASTWVVPGSHNRLDLPGEMKRFPRRPILPPEFDGKTSEQRERSCLDYCESMPGATQLRLNAGDLALYRNTLWHLGNYVPYRKRATLHDVVDTPEYAAWRNRVRSEAERRKAAGLLWENPKTTAA